MAAKKKAAKKSVRKVAPKKVSKASSADQELAALKVKYVRLLKKYKKLAKK